MRKYYFAKQVSKKFKSVKGLPGWLLNYPDYRQQIRIIRETLGMTQEQLGSKVDRSVKTIANIENGDTAPGLATLELIAKALNAELKICLVPKQEMAGFLDEKAGQRARELIKLTRTSSALEVQPPSEEEILEQLEELKREILEKLAVWMFLHDSLSFDARSPEFQEFLRQNFKIESEWEFEKYLNEFLTFFF